MLKKTTSHFPIIACLVIWAACLAIVGTKLYTKFMNPKPAMVRTISPLPGPVIKIPTTPLQASTSAPATYNPAPMEIIELTENNSVTMDQVFDDQSVSKVMLELKALSDKQPKDSTFYLVLNTPGGSVDAGLRLISFIKALPQRVKTLTLFSASMGFQTAQGLDERLILDTGTLMSHRAKFGVRGEGPGELFSRLKWIMSSIDRLDTIAASRMQMSFEDYRKLIADEYWVNGEDAVKDHAADRVVLAKCGKGMGGTVLNTVQTMFGSVMVEMSKCPLIPGVLSVKGTGEAAKASNYVKLMFTDKNRFVHEYILTNEWMKFQK